MTNIMLSNRRDDRGFGLLTITIVLGIVTASAAVLISYMLSTRHAAKVLEADYSSLQIAEAGVQEAMHCLKATSGEDCGGTYGTAYAGEANIAFGPGAFTVVVTPDDTGMVIVSTGRDGKGGTSTVKTHVAKELITDAGIQFDYAVQVGDKGLLMNNNAMVNDGPIHSNSDMDCGNGAGINNDIVISRIGGTIQNCAVGGNAYADNILNSTVTGDAYYAADPAGIAGTTVSGTKHPGSPTPAEVDLPPVDLDLWRSAAMSGGTITGDYSAPDGSSLGPAKIDGNLTITNNAHVTITGPIWVTGTVSMSNGAIMTLDPSFEGNSTIILADDPYDEADHGKIDLGNNTSVLGSGTDGSYILFVSTNTSLDPTDPAINLDNNGAGGIFLALNGIIYFTNNASAAAIAGQAVEMKNNAVINYDATGQTPKDASFTTGQYGPWTFGKNSWERL